MIATGTVKWFNAVKGYGFITADEGDKDVFVHTIDVEAARMALLTEGQRISFDAVNTPRGLQATNLAPAESACAVLDHRRKVSTGASEHHWWADG